MSRRAVVAAVVGWALVVGATSAVAWVAIDRAGREVLTTAADGRLGPGAVATSTPRTPQPTGAVSARPSHRPTSTPSSSRATATPSHRTTSGSTTPAASSSSRTSPAPPTTSRTRTTTTAAPPPGPSAVDRSVRVEGGQVTVRCVGRTASLRSAQPADGWAVHVEENGPEQVKVQFTSSGQRREIEVEAECSDGTPVFSTSDDERSDGGWSDDGSSPDD